MDNNTYLLVFSKLQYILDTANQKKDGPSFAPGQMVYREYSVANSSIQFSIKDTIIIYDIEIFEFIADENIQKWIRNSEACTNYNIIVHEDKKESVEMTCCELGISNYEVIPFRFINDNEIEIDI